MVGGVNEARLDPGCLILSRERGLQADPWFSADVPERVPGMAASSERNRRETEKARVRVCERETFTERSRLGRRRIQVRPEEEDFSNEHPSREPRMGAGIFPI